MSGDQLVRLLTVAASSRTVSDPDVALAHQAGQWLVEQGWQTHGPWFVAPAPDYAACFRAPRTWSEDGEFAIFFALLDKVAHRFGPTRRYPVHSFTQALNTLVLMDILPARFSTLGRDALHDYVEVCDRTAQRVEQIAEAAASDEVNPHAGAVRRDLQMQADTWRLAAETARTLYPLRVPA